MHDPDNEVHVTNGNNGHLMSVDCWCEPASVVRLTNNHGVEMLIIEHSDHTLIHRQDVVHHRNVDSLDHIRNPQLHIKVDSLDAAWISAILNKVWLRAAPPQDPNERNI